MNEPTSLRAFPANPAIGADPVTFPAGAKPECVHDWRMNPVVVATTTTTGDCELWTCAKRCGAQVVGPRLSSVPSSKPVTWNDPATWERRGV